MTTCRTACAAGLIAVIAAGCGSTSDDSGETSAAGSGVGANQIVFNEFFGTGSSEWLEIGNSSAEPFELTGYAIADSDKDTGLPKLSHTMVFPEGTTIAGGGHLLILTDKTDSAPGPYLAADCLTQADAPCYYATFGVSAATGEAVHLLGPDDTAITSTKYPTSVAPVAGSQASVCRVPDRSGEFVECTATPGTMNAAW